MEEVSEVKLSGSGYLKFIIKQGTSHLALRRFSDWETVGMRSSSEVKLKRRLTFNNYVAEITQNRFFDGFIMVSIILNALFMALETDYNLKYNNFAFFMITEDFFMAVYIMEFLMKVYVEPRAYWKSGYNVFDAVILVVSFITIITDGSGSRSLRFIRTIRAFRSLRVIKAVSFIPEIQAMFRAFFRTMKRAVYVLGLMLLLLFNFAIIGCFYFGDPKAGDPEDWGDLPSSMFTLFTLITLDGWTDLQKKFDDLGLTTSPFFTIVFIVIAYFIFFNMFIGVVITEMERSTKTFEADVQSEREVVLTLKKQAIIRRYKSNIRKAFQTQVGNEQHFTMVVEKFKNSLLHTDSMVMDDRCTSLAFIDTYLNVLERQKITMNKLEQLCNEAILVFSEVLEEDLLQHTQKETQKKINVVKQMQEK